MTQSILIIDDEVDIRDILSDIFADEGYEVHKAAHSEQALSLINNNKIDMIVLDIWLDNSDMDGVQILKYLKSSDHKNIPVLMISGHGNVEMAVNAMKMGAFDFIEKPFKIDHILLTASRALEQKSLKEENSRLKENDGEINAISHDYKSPAMISLMKDIQDNAESDARVLIQGAVGSGKSYIAKIIHSTSKRSKDRVLTFQCYDLNWDSMIEAINENPNSTVLLEHIEGLSHDQQSQLLQIFSKNELQTRFIVTSSQAIKESIEQGDFSSGLYDRLSILNFTIPSLNDRIEDIEILAKNFAELFVKEFHIQCPQFPSSFITSLKNYDWQGNIRQLKIMIEWSMMQYYLNPEQGLRFQSQVIQEKSDNIVALDKINEKEIYDMPLKQARDHFEKDYLETLLNRFDGNIAKMAEYIDMERTALYRKLKTMEITYQEAKAAQA